ncbi:MAG: protease inhibitor I42 family protein [Elusimicrobia bacterium]|nr:protease inhibitor I42 family protein [Elusimicrobiota bacterium]
MKRAIMAQLALALAAAAWAGDKPKEAGTEQAVNKVDAVAQPSQVEIAAGETFEIKLPCNPTTGYNWELQSINRKIAAPTGPVEFRQSPAQPGMVGVGGTCVLAVKGVKPGKTKAVLVYRRPWEKKEKPAQIFKAEIKVLPKKQGPGSGALPARTHSDTD